MKTLIFTLIFSGFCLSVNSQITDFNFSLGTSTFEEKTPEVDFLYYPSLAFSVGFGAELPLKNNLSIYSGIQASFKQGSNTYRELGNGYKFEQNSLVSIVSTSIPLMAQYTIPIGRKRIQIGAGGFMGINIFATQNYDWKLIQDGEEYEGVGGGNLKFKDQAKENEEFEIRRLDLGLKASIAYKMKNMTLRLDSEYGIRNLSQYDKSVGQFLTRSIWFSFAFPIQTKKEK